MKLTFGVGYEHDPGNKKNIYTYVSELKNIVEGVDQAYYLDFNILTEN